MKAKLLHPLIKLLLTLMSSPSDDDDDDETPENVLGEDEMNSLQSVAGQVILFSSPYWLLSNVI